MSKLLLSLNRARAKKQLADERGAAIAEFALIFPLCLLFFGVLLECGMLLNQYHILKRISYTASRMAVEYPELERDTVTNADEEHNHFELQTRIRTVIDQYQGILTGPVNITTSHVVRSMNKEDRGGPCFPSPCPVNVTRIPLARVEITMDHQGLFWGNWSLPITASTEGSYLL